MGQVNNCFMRWADGSLEGANAPQCEELSAFFARAVDGAKHGGIAEIPAHLRNTPGWHRNNVLENLRKFQKVQENSIKSFFVFAF